MYIYTFTIVTVYIYTFTIVTVYICTVTAVCVYHYFINFTFYAFFLSLSSLCKTNWLLSSSSFSSYTHKHKITNRQTHTHRQINTEIHKHTHANKPTERQIGAGVGRLWIDGSVMVALDQSLWVDGIGSRCLWIGVGGGDRCLWIDGVCACGFWFLWRRLVLEVDKWFDHKRKRKKKMLVEGGELTVRKGRMRSFPWKEEKRSKRSIKIGLSLWEMR